MRQEFCDGMLWGIKDGKNLSAGLTPRFFEEHESIWHVIKSSRLNALAKKDRPLLAVMTCDGLFSVPSPETGKIIHWNRKAEVTPDTVSVDDTLIVLDTSVLKEEEPKVKKKPTLSSHTFNWTTTAQVEPAPRAHVREHGPGRSENQSTYNPNRITAQWVTHIEAHLSEVYRNVAASLGAKIDASLTYFRTRNDMFAYDNLKECIARAEQAGQTL